MYPPSTAAIAPEAPSVGVVEFGSIATCSASAAIPPTM